ncbi:protein GVQW3-like [Uloborus diversus]|uniref:protein GVQW3-like n=1 Tax=Uloborus diversus TaxID=327109 RepID=UPI0024095F01|nr:protein GVQW3-like [Uloborus diversus]
MNRTLEQCYEIKFCVKLQKTRKKTFDLFTQIFKDDRLLYSQVKKWHRSFTEGRMEVANEAPSSSRTEDNVPRARDLLNKSRQMSFRLMSEQLNLWKTDVYRIVTEDLAMHDICAKLVSKVLSDCLRCQLLSHPDWCFNGVPRVPYSPARILLDPKNEKGSEMKACGNPEQYS